MGAIMEAAMSLGLIEGQKNNWECQYQFDSLLIKLKRYIQLYFNMRKAQKKKI